MENAHAQSQFGYDTILTGLSGPFLAARNGTRDAGHCTKAEMPWSIGSINHDIKRAEMLLRSVCKADELSLDKKEGINNHKLSIIQANSGEAGRMGIELGKRSLAEAFGENESPVECLSSSPRIAKKMRASSHIPRCQVEGCKTDLTAAKDYYRRHKVCISHSKAAKVIVGSQEQRFCQQCSRFHGLDEFDEDKRSCRRRLAGHNERRRKPPPDPLALSAGFFSACQDRRLEHALSERVCFLSPTVSGVSALWNNYCDLYNQQKGTWPRLFKHDKQLSIDGPMKSTGVERHLFPGLSHCSDDKPSSLLPQSPRGIVSALNAVPSNEGTHQYMQGSANSLGQSSTLTPLSGAEVLSGLEATPFSQGFMKVSDAGRALSLQSTMQLWSVQAPVAASLDSLTTLHTANMLSHQFADDDNVPMAQPILHGHQHRQLEWIHEKLLSSPSDLSSISTSLSVSSVNPSVSHDVSDFVGGHRYQLQAETCVVTDLCVRSATVDTACLSLGEQSMPDFLRFIPCDKQSSGRYAR